MTEEILHKIRVVYGFTQAEIAQYAGVTDSYINQVFKRKRTLSEKVSHRLIKELNLTPDKLGRILQHYEETVSIRNTI
ncbi:helix-turn-helix domain-containing protein [Paenibacillus gansuensis]|uniref:Helix-turn-helix domain-containing protein n=1 Tax=Paenibacillus gansuensis TaxID=306542 RepID=A0ABW5PLV1_9BACL